MHMCLLILLTVSAAPLRADEASDELSFARALIEMGFTDFAQDVTDQVTERWPDRATEAQLLRAELLMARRQFDEAEALVQAIPAASPEGRAIRLALANYYYAANEVDKARALYDDFFSRYEEPPTDENVLPVYREAAFALSQMLENAERFEAAADSLARVIATGIHGEQRRNVEARQAALYLSAAESGAGDTAALIEKARTLAEDVQFGGPYWVARSMVLLADAERVAGQTDAALARLEENLPLLRQIDASLKESGARDLSPKAGYHFVRGRIYEADALAGAARARGKDEATRAAARKGFGQPLNEYARILKYYGRSEFGTASTLRMRSLEETILELGGAVKRLAPVASAGPRNADELYRQGDLHYTRGEDASAIREYLRVLNLFPETAASLRVLSNLGRAYARSGDVLMAKATTAYVGERFAGQEDGGTACLILAGFFRNNELPELAEYAYHVFADHFPAHEKAPLVLFTLAQREQASDPAVAHQLFHRIVANYPRSEFYLRSLQSLGWDLHSRQEYGEAVPYFQQYAAAAPEGYDKANAMMLAADSLLRSQAYADAFSLFHKLVSVLDPTGAGNPYYADDDDRARLEALHEQASFQQAYCLSQIDGEPDRTATYRAAAIQAYDRFVEAFPGSELVPKALAGKGAVLIGLERLDEATETFEQLAADHPDSPEGRNSLFTLVTAAVDVGKLDVAQQAVDKMAAHPDDYQADMFALVGQLMLDHDLLDQAIHAYEILERTTQDPDLRERALFGLGRSHQIQGDCQQAIAYLMALIEHNDRTAYLFEADMLRARAYRECRRYDEAIEALTEVFRIDTDPVRLKQANYELALIQEAQQRKEAAFASYLRLGLNPDPTRVPELESLIKESVYRSVKLGHELQDYETVVMMADKFEKVWGRGDAWSAEIRELRGHAAIEQSRQAASASASP